MPLAAVCVNQGEEMQKEHEGHEWMVSQLPHLAAAKPQDPAGTKKSCLCTTDEPHKPGVLWGEVSSLDTLKNATGTNL